MKPLRITLCPVVAAVVLMSLPSGAPAGMPENLRLNEITATRMIVSPRRNPHTDLECTECHETVPTERPSPVAGAREFLNEKYLDEICHRCHSGKCELHPLEVRPDRSDMVMYRSDQLPLRFVFEGYFKMTCQTCHYVHYPHTGFNLLRGFSINPATQPSPFSSRLEFCKACHGEEVDLLSPHKDVESDLGCSFCHVGKPAARGKQELQAGINRLCTYCHEVYPEPHYLRFNPFPDLESEGLEEAGLRLDGDRYVCTLCHLPHGTSEYPSYLRPEFIQVARDSTRINPHETETFCLNCHPDTPPDEVAEGEKVTLLTGDINQLCNNCHSTGKIASMVHPMVPVPPEVELPPSWPLSDEGRITCQTCHDASQGAKATPGNPWLLRGGPYDNNLTLCRRCHDPMGWDLLDPHATFRTEEGCDICHFPGTVDEEGKLVPGPTRADGNFLCYRCHDYLPHPANHKHNVRPGHYDYVTMDQKTYPLDKFGRITCYTCHDTHQEEDMVLYYRKPFGLPEYSRCGGCHPF